MDAVGQLEEGQAVVDRLKAQGGARGCGQAAGDGLVQRFRHREAGPLGVAGHVLEGKRGVPGAQIGPADPAGAGDAGRAVGQHRPVRHRHGLGQDQGGAHAVAVGAVPVGALAGLARHRPDLVAAGGVGGAGPVPGGGAVQGGGPQRVLAAVPVREVVQQGPFVGQAGLLGGGGAHLPHGQQKRLSAHPRAAAVDAAAVGIGQLDGLDRLPDAAVQQLEKSAVQPGVQQGSGVIVAVVPDPLGVNVLHQQPGAFAAGVVDAGVGVALMDHHKRGVRAVNLQRDGTAHGLGRQSGCHKKVPPFKIPGAPGPRSRHRRRSGWRRTPGRRQRCAG